jgi:cytochrome c biogenesis protein
VSHDPGGIVVLVGVVLALAGLLASLFLRRRRVWVKATPSSGGGTLVQVAGLVKGADAAGTDDVSEPLADVARIAARLGAPARDAGTDDEEERS